MVPIEQRPTVTGCECKNGGFCQRHECFKSEHAFHLCRTSEAWFRKGEERRLLEQRPVDQIQERKEKEPRRGPGTELKALLSRFGVQVSGCPCQRHAAKMDAKGAKWCRENIDLIVSWLYTEAERRKSRLRKMPRIATRRLVLWAIRRSERKAEALGSLANLHALDRS